MNLPSLILGSIFVVYTVIGTEVYARFVYKYRKHPFKISILYVSWCFLFVLGAVLAMDYISRELKPFSFNIRTAFLVWLFGFSMHIWVVRRKQLQEMINSPLKASKNLGE